MSILSAWLLTVAIHGVALLLAAWMIDISFGSLRGVWRELLWRTALFGCVLTATVQIVSQQSPLAGRWSVATQPLTAVAATAAPAPRLDRAELDLAKPDLAKLDPAKFDSAKAELSAASQTLHMASNLPLRAVTHPVAISAAADTPSLTLNRLAWIVAVWFAGALFAIGRTTLNLLRLRQTLVAATAVSNPTLENELRALATQAGVAEPRLLRLDAIPSPIAASFSRIVLPAWAIDTLDASQLQAMLAHELAHVVRGDASWKLLTAYWRALFWFLPLTVVAQRRLDEIAELACDAFAAQHTGSGQGLAECLAACAEHHVHGHLLELAPAMAARQSSLLYRIERLLEGVTMESTNSGARARVIALLTLVIGAASLPAIGFDDAVVHAAQPPQPAPPAQPAKPAEPKKPDGDHNSISIHDDDNGRQTMSISNSQPGHKFRADVEGKIEFNVEETDITSLSEGGTARFEDTRAGVTHRLELAKRGDKLERRYFINGTEQPYDEDARKFMALAVVELARSGIGAEARVKRLYASGGARHVLDEIDQLPSDYVRGIYIKLLAGMGKLSSDELDRALQVAGAMKSDYERRQALSGLFDTQVLDAARQVTFLRQLAHFSSDYERAELLVSVEPRLANSAEVRQAWLDAALGVHSDYERRRTLESMLTGNRLNDDQLASVMKASDSMDSDYEHRELLVAAAKQARDIDALAPAYTRAAQNIHSAYERKEALLALINAGKLGARSADAVLQSAAQIDSSYERREVLVALARVMPADASLLEHYRDVARQLPEYDRAEAERALTK